MMSYDEAEVHLYFSKTTLGLNLRGIYIHAFAIRLLDDALLFVLIKLKIYEKRFFKFSSPISSINCFH